MHQGDRRYLHPEIAAHPVQGSSTVAGSHEEKGEAPGASLFAFAGRLDFVKQSIKTWIAFRLRSRATAEHKKTLMGAAARCRPASQPKPRAPRITVKDATFGLLRAFGIKRVFGNPGSTELPFLSDWPDDIDYVLGLQEA